MHANACDVMGVCSAPGCLGAEHVPSSMYDDDDEHIKRDGRVQENGGDGRASQEPEYNHHGETVTETAPMVLEINIGTLVSNSSAMPQFMNCHPQRMQSRSCS